MSGRTCHGDGNGPDRHAGFGSSSSAGEPGRLLTIVAKTRSALQRSSGACRLHCDIGNNDGKDQESALTSRFFIIFLETNFVQLRSAQIQCFGAYAKTRHSAVWQFATSSVTYEAVG
jgi:hypothetical protein